MWRRCLELGDPLTLDGAVKCRRSFLALHHLVVFHESLEQTEQADRYRQFA